MDIGETTQEAAARETMEEAHLEVANLSLLGVYTRVEPGVVVVVYAADAVGEAEVGHETSEIRWFAPDEVPWPELAFDSTIAALRDLFIRLGHPLPD
jgi:ADP-ribose pyrophosphatase YjhB (NUDIX family)